MQDIFYGLLNLAVKAVIGIVVGLLVWTVVIYMLASNNIEETISKGNLERVEYVMNKYSTSYLNSSRYEDDRGDFYRYNCPQWAAKYTCPGQDDYSVGDYINHKHHDVITRTLNSTYASNPRFIQFVDRVQ